MISLAPKRPSSSGTRRGEEPVPSLTEGGIMVRRSAAGRRGGSRSSAGGGRPDEPPTARNPDAPE